MYVIYLNWFGKFTIEPIKIYPGDKDKYIADHLNITKSKLQRKFNKFGGVRLNLDGPTIFRSITEAEQAIEWLESVEIGNALIKKK